MAHKTDGRRYGLGRTIATLAQARAAKAQPATSAPSPEVEMCREALGTLVIPGGRGKPARSFYVVAF